MDNNSTRISEAIAYIQENVSSATLYEQLSEELIELAHACLKYARILRGESPSPVEKGEALKSISEEYTDVSLMMDITEVFILEDQYIYEKKLKRFYERLMEGDNQ